MANNVGDSITFTLSGAPPSGGGYTYVWKWWDNTSDTTAVPSVIKVLNTGGLLSFTVIQCDAFGRSQSYNSSIAVNFPPVIIGPPSISNNDANFPFSTVLSSISYDPDHPGGTNFPNELSFAWYNGSILISTGTTTIQSQGTFQNQLGLVSVGSNQTLTQVITDTGTGITRLNYFIRGVAAAGLQGSGATISNSIVNSANNLSEIIIGPGQEATFTAYAQDTSAGNLSFLWSAGTLNGWSSGTQITQTPPQLPNGLYKSQITLPVNAESPGVKTVTCTVTNLVTLQSIGFNNAVNLVAPLPPTITAISTDAPLINGGYAVSQAGFVHFSATASDPNNALLAYRWTFLQPAVVFYGKTVMLRPSDYSVFDEVILVGNGTNAGTGPLPITGQVTVIDRFGQSSTVSLNQFVTALVWPFTQVSPETSGTGSTSLQKRYWGVSAQTTLEATDLLNLNSDFSSQRNMSQSFNPTAQYIYIIYPASFGLGTISLQSGIATDWLLTVVTFNAVSYNVYRSPSQITGSTQVTVS